MATIVPFKESLALQEDLTTATTNQKYPLGHRVKVYDDTYAMESEYIYVLASTGLTAYVPMALRWTGTTGAEVTLLAPALSGTTGVSEAHNMVVPQIAATSGYYFFAPIKGYARSVWTATTAPYSAGVYVGITNGAAVWTSTGNTTVLAKSFAVVRTAATSASAALYINLLDRFAQVTS